ASVADATGSPITIGKVDFLEGNTTLGSVNLDGRRQVTLSTTFNTPGTHTVIAHYEGATVGNNALQPSNSVETREVVQGNNTPPPANVATVTTLDASPSSVHVGESVTFTAKVTTATGAPVIKGEVSISEGDRILKTLPLDKNGVAVYMTSFDTAGTHTIVARYSGDTSGNVSFLASISKDTPTVVTDNSAPPEVNQAPQSPIITARKPVDQPTQFSLADVAIALARSSMNPSTSGAISAGIATPIAAGSTATASAATSAGSSFRVGGGQDAAVEEAISTVADLESKSERGRDTILVMQSSSNGSPGAAYSGEAGGRHPLSVEVSPDGSGASEKPSPFTKTLASAGDSEDKVSLLILQAEGKALRVGSSITDADDGMATVLAVAGSSRLTPIQAVAARKTGPVERIPHDTSTAKETIAAKEQAAQIVQVEKDSPPKNSHQFAQVRSWLVATAAVFGAAVATAWRWRSFRKRRARELKNVSQIPVIRP
ncbi:MAG TPA: Ig-like domain-containing protein, partial [Gemmataceae bacterium]|nr:Ig-like domain-containing protein [Gemmataceae bacterium]